MKQLYIGLKVLMTATTETANQILLVCPTSESSLTKALLELDSDFFLKMILDIFSNFFLKWKSMGPWHFKKLEEDE